MLTGVEKSVIYIALTYLRSFTGVQQAMFLCCVYLYCFVCNVGSMADDRGWSVGKPMTSKATEAVPGLVQSAGFKTAPSSLSECGGGELLLFCPGRGSTVV